MGNCCGKNKKQVSPVTKGQIVPVQEKKEEMHSDPLDIDRPQVITSHKPKYSKRPKHPQITKRCETCEPHGIESIKVPRKINLRVRKPLRSGTDIETSVFTNSFETNYNETDILSKQIKKCSMNMIRAHSSRRQISRSSLLSIPCPLDLTE